MNKTKLRQDGLQVGLGPCGRQPPVHGRGAADPELVPESGVPPAPQQGLQKLAAATAGQARLGPLADDGSDRVLGRNSRISSSSNHRSHLGGQVGADTRIHSGSFLNKIQLSNKH